MATAKKLPSGTYRVRIYDHTENGKKIYKSFSANTKKKAEYLAAQYLLEKEKNAFTPLDCYDLTVKDAIRRYIDSRKDTLSPSTLREYERQIDKDYESIGDVKLKDVSVEMMQKYVNDLALDNSPKTVRNKYGLLISSIRLFKAEFSPKIKFPTAIRKVEYIPTDNDIQSLLGLPMGYNLKIAILLACFGPLRRSEISALEYEDLSEEQKNGTKIAHIQRAIVLSENKEWITKSTKSSAGDRYIPLPKVVWKEFKGKTGRIVPVQPSTITSDFINLVNRSKLPKFRFHALRHYCASMLHTLGVPDAYIIQRGGWEDDKVLHQIYRHALDDMALSYNDLANDHFTSILEKV